MAKITIEAEKLKIDTQFEKATKDLTQLGMDVIGYCKNNRDTNQLIAISETVTQLIEDTERANLNYSTMNNGQSNQYYENFRDTAEKLVDTITTHIDSKLEGFVGDL